MKAIYLFACVLCAVALSLLGAIVATGRIPFSAPPETQAPAAPARPVALADSNRKSMAALVEALQDERRAYQKKSADLADREKILAQKQELLAALKKEVQDLQRALDAKVLRLAESEQANCKRLADMCGKMEPGSAASMLKEMEAPRAAAILGLLGERQAAALLDAAVASGESGAKMAAQWSDIIRLSVNEKGKSK